MIHIGPPYSASAKKVMILGGGELGKEMIIALQRLGIACIAVHHDDHAPGHHVAHHGMVTDMTNTESLYRIILQEKPSFVIPESERIAPAVFEKLSAHQEIRVVPSTSALFYTMNREHLRYLVAEKLHIPTPKYAFAHSLAELKNIIGRSIAIPCFVKALVSSSGKGQTQVLRKHHIPAAWQRATTQGCIPQQRVLVEETIHCEAEITLLAVRTHQKRRDSLHFCEPIEHTQKNGLYIEAWQPASLSVAVGQKIVEYTQKILSKIAGYGLFGCEFFICQNEVFFSEISARPHDTGFVTLATQEHNQFDLHIRAMLGFSVNTTCAKAGASYALYAKKTSSQAVFSQLEKALAVPQSSVHIFGKPNTYPQRRLAIALATASSVSLARKRVHEIAQCIRIQEHAVAG